MKQKTNTPLALFFFAVCVLSVIPTLRLMADSPSVTAITEDNPVVTTGMGTLDDPYTATDAIAVANALGADVLSSKQYYIKGIISKITYSFSTEYGTARFFISDDGKTGNQLQIYDAYYLDNRKWSDGNTQINVGDEVIIYGNLINYNGTIPETADKKAYIYSLNGQTENEILKVTYTSNPTIKYGNYRGTLADGSVLFFNLNQSVITFCGATSSAISLSVPERIYYNGTVYTVSLFGHYGADRIDFTKAQTVTSLTLPASITGIGNIIPETITDLHLLSETPPTNSSNYISNNTKVWVPFSAYTSYLNLTMNTGSDWYGVEVHYEGWNPQALTVNVSAPGNLAAQLLKQAPILSDVNELTVIGPLNDDDIKMFSRLSQLQKLDLSQTDITTMYGCEGLKYLQTVLLPSTVRIIGDNAFQDCSKLNSINTPNVEQVGGNSFNGCSSLVSIDLRAATVIGSNAFMHCALQTLTLPVAKTIGGQAFYDCSFLKTVRLAEGLESIPGLCFYRCTSLNDINFPSTLKSIGYRAFFGGDSWNDGPVPITSAILPEGLQSIGEYAFYKCPLTTLTLPEGLQSIGKYAFYKCPLTTLTFPEGLQSIGKYAFYECSLTTLTLPEGLQIIDDEAFEMCPMTTISIPSTIQNISSDAFAGCSNVKDVYCYAIIPPSTTAFVNMAGATLHVPTLSLTSYMFNDNWKRFFQTIAIEGKLDNLTINQAFSITNYDGLADKINLTLGTNGHLTVSAGSTFNIGTFTQSQSTFNKREYDYYSGNYVYKFSSTLIANNAMKADNVNLHLLVQTNRWNFISLPFDVNVSDIEYPEGTLWVIRKYSGADRAALTGNTWQNMTNGMVLQAGEGYILHCANESTNEVTFVFHPVNNAKKNGLFAYQNVVKPLATYASERAHNRSWNLVGNPYPAYFDTRYIEHNGVITVYNGNSYSGSYTAYSLLDDDYVLRPNEAFFVQCPADATSMTFKAEGRTHESNNNEDYYYSRAHQARMSSTNNRHVYNFTLSNEEFSDRTRLVINPDAKMDYEISCDASKFMSDNMAVPQLYVYDNGIRYAIDERPLGDGIVTLGARFGQTGEYTIALKSNPTEAMSIMLTDNETGDMVNLAEDNYTFTAQAGTSESRFMLTIGNGDTTGITDYNRETTTSNRYYDLQGRVVDAQSKKGIVVLKQNGNSRKVIK